MNYLTEFDLYIDIVLILFCAKILFLNADVRREQKAEMAKVYNK